MQRFFKEWFKNWNILDSLTLLWIIGLTIIVLMISGCILATLNQVKEMTPEQIAEYAKINMKVFVCFQLTGPPPLGAVTYMIMPNTATVDLQFNPNCSLMRANVIPR